MKRVFSFTFMMGVLLLLSACSNSDNDMAREGENMAMYSMEESMELNASNEQMDMEMESERVTQKNTINGVEDRKVIYTGDIFLEVEDYHETEIFIEGKIDSMGGYIVESSFHDYHSGEIFTRIAARIPMENFHSFIEQLDTEEIKVVEKNITGNDVTEEYIDLQSRLRSKKTVEERLLTFLDKASTTEELLAVSKDLSEIQEEIEQLIGRIHYLDNHVDYSTIHIHVQEKKTVSSLQDNEPLNTWGNAKNLFIDTIQFIISFFSKGIVFIIGLSPVIIPVTVLSIIIYRFKKRRSRKDTTSPDE